MTKIKMYLFQFRNPFSKMSSVRLYQQMAVASNATKFNQRVTNSIHSQIQTLTLSFKQRHSNGLGYNMRDIDVFVFHIFLESSNRSGYMEHMFIAGFAYIAFLAPTHYAIAENMIIRYTKSVERLVFFGGKYMHTFRIHTKSRAFSELSCSSESYLFIIFIWYLRKCSTCFQELFNTFCEFKVFFIN